jgi:hypothetical protein
MKPPEVEFLMTERAVPQIEIDGGSGKACPIVLRASEIGYRRFVQTNGDRLFNLAR